MAIYNPVFTTNAKQEKGLDNELLHENARRAAENPSRAAQVPPLPPLLPWTKAQMLSDKIDEMVKAYAKAYTQDVRVLVGNAVDNATTQQLTDVATALGIVLP